MPRDARRFQRGSGVYKCECCGRMTRSTGRGDNEYNKTCAECYDLAGLENHISDSYDKPEDCRENVRDEINDLYNAVIAKGGKPRFEYMMLIEKKS